MKAPPNLPEGEEKISNRISGKFIMAPESKSPPLGDLGGS